MWCTCVVAGCRLRWRCVVGFSVLILLLVVVATMLSRLGAAWSFRLWRAKTAKAGYSN